MLCPIDGRFATVLDCMVLRERETNKSRGFGFVTILEEEKAQIILNSSRLVAKVAGHSPGRHSAASLSGSPAVHARKTAARPRLQPPASCARRRIATRRRRA